MGDLLIMDLGAEAPCVSRLSPKLASDHEHITALSTDCAGISHLFSVSRILLTGLAELCILSRQLRYFAVRTYPIRHPFIIISVYQLYLQYMLRWLVVQVAFQAMR